MSKALQSAVEKLMANPEVKEISFWVYRVNSSDEVYLNEEDVYINSIRTTDCNAIEGADDYIRVAGDLDLSVLPPKAKEYIQRAVVILENENKKIYKARPFAKEFDKLDKLISKWNLQSMSIRDKIYKYFVKTIKYPDHSKDIFVTFKRDNDQIKVEGKQWDY
jgi:hypothetical protein